MTGRISELTEMTSVANDDYIEIIDQSGTPNNDSRNMRILKQNFGKDIVTTKTATATLTVAEQGVILLNTSTSAMTITLPAASGNTGLYYKLIYISTTGQPVVIDANASETINGNTTITMEHYLGTCSLVCDGSNWWADFDPSGFGRENQFLFTDDFSNSSGTEASSVHGELGWSALIDGTTGDNAVQIDVPDINHVGVESFGSGTTSGNDWAISLGGSAAIRFMDADTLNWSQTMIMRIPTITTLTVRLGVAETTTGASWEGADNAFFKFDPAVSANWQCITFGSAAQTTTTGTAVVATTFYKLKIVKDGTTIRFYLDDVNVANHSTQVPANAVNPCMQVQTNTAALRAIEIDYFRLSGMVAR